APLSEGSFRKKSFQSLVRRNVSSVVFRNVTSEPTSKPGPQPEGDAEAGPPEPLTITDPTVIRALAHPVRMGLIELLGVRETLTATQASEALGESPANCAFHLRTLAKYGFVEEAGGGRGRERPWRRAQSGVSIPEGSERQEGGADATALFDFLTQTLLDKARTSLAARQSWPGEWQDALDQGEFVNYMTPAEAR